MPFLAPAIPAIASTVGGSLLGKFLGGNSTAQNNANNALTTLSTNAGNNGMTFLNQATANTGASGNYFQSILNGNQASPTTALAPQLAETRANVQNTLQSTTNLAPRGAGRSSTLFNLPENEQSQQQSVFNSARPEAAQALASLGLGEGGLGANLTGTAIAGTNDLATQLANQRKQQFATGAALGSGIYNAAKGINWSSLFGGGGGGGSNGGGGGGGGNSSYATSGSSGYNAFPTGG